VHQSAKDFLFAKASNEVFPESVEDVRRTIFLKSLEILSRTLQRDMYSMKAPGFPIQNFESPNLDVLATLLYPCIYWIDHLHDWITKPVTNVGDLKVAGIIGNFLRMRYLYWLEGLSLCRSVGKGAVSMTKVWSLVQV
jgi:hypothetical protein